MAGAATDDVCLRRQGCAMWGIGLHVLAMAIWFDSFYWSRPAIYRKCPLLYSYEVPLHFTPGWHSGDAGVCLWAVHGATELRVFTVVAFCAAWNGGGML